MSSARDATASTTTVSVAQPAAPSDERTAGVHKAWALESGDSPSATALNHGSTAARADLPPRATPETAYRARLVGREVARQTLPEERERLFAEHDALTTKMFADGLSKAEERRLTYLRWNLDRIRDAEMGDQLDALEEIAVLQERTANQIGQFLQQVQNVQRSTGRRR